MKNKQLFYLYLVTLLFIVNGCTTPSTLTPIADKPNKNYNGKATILIAVTGTDSRKVRHIEIGTQEEEGYEIYFHTQKISEGFISLKIPTPSTYVYIAEYSLTGMYGCSRGNAGYGNGVYKIPKIIKNKTYFLGTINTSMNTTYKEIPEELLEEAKEKYNYFTQKKAKKKKLSTFKSRIKL